MTVSLRSFVHSFVHPFVCMSPFSYIEAFEANFHQRFTSVLLVFHQHFTSVSPVFHQFFNSVLYSVYPVFQKCFKSGSKVLWEWFQSVCQSQCFKVVCSHWSHRSCPSIRRACFQHKENLTKFFFSLHILGPNIHQPNNKNRWVLTQFKST